MVIWTFIFYIIKSEMTEVSIQHCTALFFLFLACDVRLYSVSCLGLFLQWTSYGSPVSEMWKSWGRGVLPTSLSQKELHATADVTHSAFVHWDGTDVLLRDRSEPMLEKKRGSPSTLDSEGRRRMCLHWYPTRKLHCLMWAWWGTP